MKKDFTTHTISLVRKDRKYNDVFMFHQIHSQRQGLWSYVYIISIQLCPCSWKVSNGGKRDASIQSLHLICHDDVIKWKHFPRYWPFVRGIHRSPVNSPHKGQWRGALMFSLICIWINGWVNNGKAGDLRRHRAHYDVTVMCGLTTHTDTQNYNICFIQYFAAYKPAIPLLNRLFRRRSKRASKLRVAGLCAGNSPVTDEFPAQMASNAENVSIWWRHHVAPTEAVSI